MDLTINLEDLVLSYRTHGRAAEAASLMKKLGASQSKDALDTLLRHHNERSVTSGPEIRQRDSFDYLIASYSILEIASLIRFIREPIESPLRDEIYAELSCEAVRKYYEESYPLLLPSLFRRRLQRSWSLQEMSGDEITHALFQSFLSLESRVRSDHDVDLFLWFLDDGHSGGFSLPDAMKCLSNRPAFLERILRSQEEQDDLDAALRGFGKFLTICVDFDSLLQRCSPWRLFQSALWHYYAYWFELIGEKVGNSLREAIRNCFGWKPEQSSLENQLMSRFINDATGCIDRLLSTEYGIALRSASQNSPVVATKTSQPHKKAEPHRTLRINETAPDFIAQTTQGQIDFHEWIGNGWAILFSHPKSFNPVSTTELGYIAAMQAEFTKRNTKIIGLSVDPTSSHIKWVLDIEETQGHKVTFPMIGDPELKIAKLYDMLPTASGETAEGRTAADNATVRTVFVIGPDKKIKLMLSYPMSTGLNFDEVLRVLDSMQLTAKHKVATPVNWKQGNDVIILPSVPEEEARQKFPAGWKAPKPYMRIVPQPK